MSSLRHRNGSREPALGSHLTVSKSTDVVMYPSKSSIFYRLMWNYLPDRLLALAKYTPTRQYSRLRYTNKIFTRVASRLLAERNDQSVIAEKASRPKDVMSILGKMFHNSHIVVLMYRPSKRMQTRRRTPRHSLAVQRCWGRCRT